jgi:hypothetical protein
MSGYLLLAVKRDIEGTFCEMDPQEGRSTKNWDFTTNCNNSYVTGSVEEVIEEWERLGIEADRQDAYRAATRSRSSSPEDSVRSDEDEEEIPSTPTTVGEHVHTPYLQSTPDSMDSTPSTAPSTVPSTPSPSHSARHQSRFLHSIAGTFRLTSEDVPTEGLRIQFSVEDKYIWGTFKVGVYSGGFRVQESPRNIRRGQKCKVFWLGKHFLTSHDEHGTGEFQFDYGSVGGVLNDMYDSVAFTGEWVDDRLPKARHVSWFGKAWKRLLEMASE